MYDRKMLTYIKVADTGSFARAAEELFISPVSVMKQMNALEEELGLKLLLRTNQGVRLTPAGRSIYKDAQRIILFSGHAVKKAQEIESSRNYTIRLATSILRPHGILMDLWEKIGTRDLPFQFWILPFSADETGMNLMLDLLGDEVDAFFGPCDSSLWRQNYNVLHLQTGKCCIAVPRSHRLAGKSLIGWSDLDYENLMMEKRDDSSVLVRMHREIEREHPLIYPVDVPGNYDIRAFNECVEMDYIMQSLDIWSDIHPGLVTLPVDWDYTMPYGLIYSKEPSAAMEEFVRVLCSGLELPV